MNTKEIRETLPTTIDGYLALTDEHLFTKEKLGLALGLLENGAGTLVADVNTPEGRKEINKTSRAIGGAIKRLDDRRRAYVAELKAKPKAIDDLFRETFRKKADALKDKVRAPLDEWTENQRLADEETMRLLAIINEPVEVGTSAEALAKRLDDLKCMDLPDWLNEGQRESLTNTLHAAMPRVQAAHDAAVQAEQQAAELEELRKLKAEQERKEREAQIAKEAAERAKQEAEAKAKQETERAERERMAAEQAAIDAKENAQRMADEAVAKAQEQWGSMDFQQPVNDKKASDEESRISESQQPSTRVRTSTEEQKHKAQINRAIVTSLVSNTDITEQQAKVIVIAIIKGKVPNVSITY